MVGRGESSYGGKVESSVMKESREGFGTGRGHWGKKWQTKPGEQGEVTL